MFRSVSFCRCNTKWKAVRKAGDECRQRRGVKNRVRRESEDFKETSKDGEEAMDTSSSMQLSFYRSIFFFHRIGLSKE